MSLSSRFLNETALGATMRSSVNKLVKAHILCFGGLNPLNPLNFDSIQAILNLVV